MPRRRHGPTHDTSPLESNDYHHATDDDEDDFGVNLDLRDIPGQIEKAARYIERNKNRSTNFDVDTLYADEGNGTRVGRWSGRRNAGKSYEAGLLSATAEASVTDDSDQKGIEAEASVLSISQLAEIQADL